MTSSSRVMDRALKSHGGPTGLRACWPTVVFLLILAFDFKAETGEGGQAQQYLLFIAALTAAVVGALPLFKGNAREWRLPFTVWMPFATVAAAVVLWPLNDATTADFLRLLSPYILCMCGALLGERNARESPVTQSYLMSAILVIGLISTAWTLIYGVGIRGLDLMEGRYQIVSAIIPQLLGIGLLVLAYPLPQRWLAGVAVAVSLLMVVVSVTRSFLLAAIGTLLYLLWCVTARGVNLRTLRIILTAGGLLVVGAVVVIAVSPEFLQRWTDRISNEATESGDQITVVTREAEWVSQVSMLMQSTRKLLIGNGLGARYFWDERTLSRINGYENMVEFKDGVIELGHSFWVYQIFAGGVLTGWLLPLQLILCLSSNLIGLARLLPLQKKGGIEPRVMWDIALGSCYFAAVLAVFILSFSSNPMSFRLNAAMFGFVMAASFSHLRLARQRARV